METSVYHSRHVPNESEGKAHLLRGMLIAETFKERNCELLRLSDSKRTVSQTNSLKVFSSLGKSWRNWFPNTQSMYLRKQGFIVWAEFFKKRCCSSQ